MASLPPQQVYQAAKAAGFGDLEALVMTATAFFESTLNLNPGGNGGGLLQFEPSTWQAAGVSCSISDLTCQMQAAHNLISSGKGTWYNTWFAPEAAQQNGGSGSNPTSAQIDSMAGKYKSKIFEFASSSGANVSPITLNAFLDSFNQSGGLSGLLSGTPLTSPNEPLGAAGAVVSKVVGWPGEVLNNIGKGISGGLVSAGEHLLPWLIILGVGAFALFMIGHELSSGHGGMAKMAAESAAA